MHARKYDPTTLTDESIDIDFLPESFFCPNEISSKKTPPENSLQAMQF